MATSIKMSSSKTYLVTGGSGFLGAELISRIPGKVRVIARNEGNLIALKEKFPHIEIIPGSIADPFVVEKAIQGVDGIFHLAAFKHVGLAENHVKECVESNVIGTLNLLEATLKHKPEFIIGISTDKAAQVTGVYGATKLLQEKLFEEYEFNIRCLQMGMKIGYCNSTLAFYRRHPDQLIKKTSKNVRKANRNTMVKKYKVA